MRLRSDGVPTRPTRITDDGPVETSPVETSPEETP